MTPAPSVAPAQQPPGSRCIYATTSSVAQTQQPQRGRWHHATSVGIVALEQQCAFYATKRGSVGVVVGNFQIASIYISTLLFFSIFNQPTPPTTLEFYSTLSVG